MPQSIPRALRNNPPRRGRNTAYDNGQRGRNTAYDNGQRGRNASPDADSLALEERDPANLSGGEDIIRALQSLTAKQRRELLQNLQVADANGSQDSQDPEHEEAITRANLLRAQADEPNVPAFERAMLKAKADKILRELDERVDPSSFSGSLKASLEAKKKSEGGFWEKSFRYVHKDREKDVVAFGRKIHNFVNPRDRLSFEEPQSAREMGALLANGLLINPAWNLYRNLEPAANGLRGLVRGVYRPFVYPRDTWENKGKYMSNWLRCGVSAPVKGLRQLVKIPFSVVNGAYNSVNTSLDYLQKKTIAKIPLVGFLSDKVVFGLTRGVGKVFSFLDETYSGLTDWAVNFDEKHVATWQNAQSKGKKRK